MKRAKKKFSMWRFSSNVVMGEQKKEREREREKSEESLREDKFSTLMPFMLSSYILMGFFNVHKK
jgi:hypothetical protein